MLRLDLVYCISFSICHHARPRLIVWRFLLVKAFKRCSSGCVSCVAYGSKSERRWLSASCCFMSWLITLSAADWLGWRHQADPENLSRKGLDNCRSSHCNPFFREAASGAAQENVEGSALEGWGGSCCASSRLEGMGALLFVGSFQHPVVTGPIFKLQILNHIWSEVVDVCLYLSCLAPGIKFPSNKSGNCILSSLCSRSRSPRWWMF